MASPMSRSIMGDVTDRDALVKSLMYLGLLLMVIPFFAPTVGLYIELLWGWRAIFILFSICLGIFTLWVAYSLPETHPNPQQIWQPIALAKQYGSLVANKLFWQTAACSVIGTGLTIAFYTTMPFWFVVHFGIPKEFYTYWALFVVVSGVGGYFCGRFFALRYPLKQTILAGIILLFLEIILVIIFAFYWHPSLLNALVIMSLTAFISGFLSPPSNALSLHTFPEIKGMVSSLYPISIFLVASGSAWLFSNMPMQSYKPLLIIFIPYLLIGIWQWHLLKNREISSEKEIS